MKRILAFILLLALTLSGCKGSSEPSEESSAAFKGYSLVL